MKHIKEQLLSDIKPMLVTSWNINNIGNCCSVNAHFVYFPLEYDGTNPPVIRYTLIMDNGREQTNFNCDKPFVEMISCIVKCIYEKKIGYKGC